MDKFEIKIGAILFTLAIIFGAFGAHALKELVNEEALKTFEVAVRYQFYQALGFLFLGLGKEKFGFNLRAISIGMLIGLSLFCCSIYGIALKETLPFTVSFLGPITPIGGAILIFSWAAFITKIYK
jgi:uncharacterized membrane protein YgdD (TMEM256/DUF423 family)